MSKAGTRRTENPGVVLPALLDLGIHPTPAGNGGKNLKPGCVSEVSCGVSGVHQGTEENKVPVGVSEGVTLLNLKPGMDS